MLEVFIFIPTVMAFFGVIMPWPNGLTFCNIAIFLLSFSISFIYERRKKLQKRNRIKEVEILGIIAVGLIVYALWGFNCYDSFTNDNQIKFVSIFVIVSIQYLIVLIVNCRNKEIKQNTHK